MTIGLGTDGIILNQFNDHVDFPEIICGLKYWGNLRDVVLETIYSHAYIYKHPPDEDLDLFEMFSGVGELTRQCRTSSYFNIDF